MSGNKSNSRIIHIDFIRIVAILFVMFVHSGQRGADYYQITSNRFLGGLSLIMSIICNSGVFLFFLVSGAVLLSHPESPVAIYRKRLPRMVVILLAFSIIRYLYVMFFGEGWENAGIRNFFDRLITDTIFSPFWFLYAYISILIVLPFLKKMIKHMEHFEWAAFGIISLVFVILGVMRVFGMPETDISFLFSGAPVLAFILGYAAENDCFGRSDAISPGKRICIYALFCAVLIAAQFILVFQYDLPEIMSVSYLSVLLAYCEYRIIKISFSKRGMSAKTTDLICAVASCSFGIYLTEDYIRNWLSGLFTVLEKRMTTLPAGVVWIMISYLLTLAVVYIYKAASYKVKNFSGSQKGKSL